MLEQSLWSADMHSDVQYRFQGVLEGENVSYMYWPTQAKNYSVRGGMRVVEIE